MDEFHKKRRFKTRLLIANYLVYIPIYLLTDLLSTRLMITWLSAICVMIFGFHFSTPTHDKSTRLTSVVLAVLMPLTAAFDPSSLYIAETFIIPAHAVLYFLGELEHIDYTFTGVSISSWTIYWLCNKEMFWSTDSANLQETSPRFYRLIIQLLVDMMISFNTSRYVEHINALLKSQKEDRMVIESHLKTQEKLNAELKKTMEMNDNFLMAFSHELKNPLNALLGSIELALDEFITEEVRFLLTNAQMSGRMLLHLLTNILDSGKIQLNKLDVNPQSGNFIEYLENFWHTASMLIKPKGLNGFLSVEKNFPTNVLFDQHRLSQILLNLVSNSLKFTERGDIRIMCSFERGTELPFSKFESRYLDEIFLNEEIPEGGKHNPRNTTEKKNPMTQSFVAEEFGTENSEDHERFHLDLQKKTFPKSFFKRQCQFSDGYIRIEIVDTGCGMKPHQVGQLFQRFSQVNENTTKRQIGTGLGLWISKELCKLMQGDIKVSSIEGVGTSFVFLIKTQSSPNEDQPSQLKKLPSINTRSKIEFQSILDSRKNVSFIQRSASMVQMPDLSNISYYQPKSPVATKKALIAEDLVYNREIYKRMLKKEGVEVVIANDGAEAVKIFKSSPPRTFQFLLFDLNMPNLDGIAASKEIREYEATNLLKHTHILIATGHCTQETRNLCLDPKGSVRAFDVLIKPLTQANLSRICELTKSK